MITRGVKHEVDQFINDLQAQFWKHTWFKNKKHPNVAGHVRCGVRPIQLWEIAYPKTEEQLVLKTIFNKNPAITQWNRRLGLGAIQKMLGAKKVPKFDEKMPKRILGNDAEQWVARYPIGIREDNYDEYGNEDL